MIPYERWGERGPLILCIHGLGSSRRDFRRLGEALAGECRVVAYDQRGHGDRAREHSSMRLDALVGDLHELVGALEEEIALLIGASWGGAVALLGGASIARRLLLIDPLIRVVPGTFREYVDDLAAFTALPSGPERDAAVARAFAGAHPLDREGKQHALHALELAAIEQLGRENRMEEGAWDLREALRCCPLPVRILLADEESVVARGDLADLPERVVVMRVLGHGHTLHRSAFDVFERTVRELVLPVPHNLSRG